MTRTPMLISALLLGYQPGAVIAQNRMPKPIQTAEVLDKEIRKTIHLKYLLFLPKGYEPNSSQRWPMILFLHGIGERGQDPSKVKAYGPPKVADVHLPLFRQPEESPWRRQFRRGGSWQNGLSAATRGGHP